MTKRKAVSLVLSTLTAITLSTAWCPILHGEESLRKRIDRLVQPYLDNEIVVGMTIGVLHQDQEKIFGYGRMSKEDSRVPDGETVYEIGSMSKIFTGVLLADAVTQGHVKLDQAAGELLPSGVKMPSRGERAITLQDLSTHVSGLPRIPDNMKMTDPGNPFADYAVEDLYAFLNSHQLSRAPGEKSEYSNLGQGLLGHLLARQGSTTYERLLRDRIATPLNMTSTSITLNEQQQSRLAPPHLGDGQAAFNWDIPTLAGAGAIRSTASDMLRFARANLAPPVGKVGEAIETAWRIHQKPLAKGQLAMGLGWHVARDGSTRWHNGQTGGYHSMLLVNRGIETSVVLLTNTATGDVDQLAEDIIRLIAGAKVEPPTFERSITVSSKVMRKYVGKYELAPGIVFTVTVKDDKLMVGLTGQSTFQVYARSETEWYYKVVEATLTFKVDDNGRCNSIELFQNGVRQVAKRIEQ